MVCFIPGAPPPAMIFQAFSLKSMNYCIVLKYVYRFNKKIKPQHLTSDLFCIVFSHLFLSLSPSRPISPSLCLSLILRSITELIIMLRFGPDLLWGNLFIHQAKARCYFLLVFPGALCPVPSQSNTVRPHNVTRFARELVLTSFVLDSFRPADDKCQDQRPDRFSNLQYPGKYGFPACGIIGESVFIPFMVMNGPGNQVGSSPNSK